MNAFLYRELPSETVAELGRAFPGVSFRQSTDADALQNALEWAEVVFGNPPAELVARASRLCWLQIVSSGFDDYTALRNTTIVVTTAHGIHAPIIAQHALATILWFSRGLPYFTGRQRERVWDRRPSIPHELARQTVGIVGYGEVGRTLAQYLRPLGPRLLATKRTAAPTPPELDVLFTFDQLDELLGQSDHVVIALPLTPQTRGLFDATRLRGFKAGAVVHNVLRGGLIDETALVERLREGSLGGAALDVFEQEPLPRENPFWEMPHVVVTPHIAGHHRDLGVATLERFRQNLQRYIAGLPLLQVADFARGY